MLTRQDAGPAIHDPEVIADSWRIDETYVKVKETWTYLYRAVDKLGQTMEFYLSPTRTIKAAKQFLGKALNGMKA